MKILRITAIFSTVILFLLFLNYEKWMHQSLWKYQPLAAAITLLTAVFPAVVLFMEILYWFDKSKPQSALRLPFVIFVVAMALFMIINPFGLGKQEIKYRGYWTGNGTRGEMIVYKDGVFKIEWAGLIRGGQYNGTWKNKDSLMELTYAAKELDRVGTLIMYKNKTLIPVDGHSNAFLQNVEFKCDVVNP